MDIDLANVVHTGRKRCLFRVIRACCGKMEIHGGMTTITVVPNLPPGSFRVDAELDEQVWIGPGDQIDIIGFSDC